MTGTCEQAEPLVAPAKAGIPAFRKAKPSGPLHVVRPWVPAFAGTTVRL
jgi:hypothetical protein